MCFTIVKSRTDLEICPITSSTVATKTSALSKIASTWPYRTPWTSELGAAEPKQKLDLEFFP